MTDAPEEPTDDAAPAGPRLDTSGLRTLVVDEREDRLHVALHRPQTRNAIDRPSR